MLIMPRGKGKKKQPAEDKVRTRAHVIADLSVNSVERLFLLEGHTCNRPESDYGYDLQVFTFAKGAFENGSILIQLKATDRLVTVEKGTFVSFGVERADLKLWSGELYPVILVVWDAKAETGYWLHIQDYLEKSPDYPLPDKQAKLQLRLPITNVLDAIAVEKIRHLKNATLATLRN